MKSHSAVVVIRGGGDLASGVALRLHRCRFRVIITELPQPLTVRRRVAFAEAIYGGIASVEDCTGCRVVDPGDLELVRKIMDEGKIQVLIDPEGHTVRNFKPAVVVDARMLKRHSGDDRNSEMLLIGLGPGFVAGKNCDAVVETNRGISLGRVVWKGSGEPDTGIPDAIGGHAEERALRSPAQGPVIAHAEIGDHLEAGQLIAEVGGQPVCAAFSGMLRGLIHPGLVVEKNMKIGDLDPRDDWRACIQVSDKALSVAGGVLEAMLASGPGGQQQDVTFIH